MASSHGLVVAGQYELDIVPIYISYIYPAKLNPTNSSGQKKYLGYYAIHKVNIGFVCKTSGIL